MNGYQLNLNGLEPWEHPENRIPNSGFQYSYGVEYGALSGGSIFWIFPGLWGSPGGFGEAPGALGKPKDLAKRFMKAWSETAKELKATRPATA